MRHIFLFYASFIPLLLCAQLNLSGKIIDYETNKPIEQASVFINNSTIGTISSADGKFKLSGLYPGSYDLVISMIGYEPMMQTINLNNSDTILIKLKTKWSELKPVIILPDKLRLYYLNLFKKAFIGKTQNAFSCRILNTDILSFDFDDKNHTLRVSADDFIIVVNQSLGYRIEFLLNQFIYKINSNNTYSTYYEGQALFKELQANKAKRNRWAKNRLKSYRGSTMHFFRSAAENNLSANGFILHTLIRKKNEQRPTDEIIESKIDRFSKPSAAMTQNDYDSLNYWTNKSQLSKEIQFLLRDTLNSNKIIFKTDIPEIFALKFQNYLYVIFADGKSEFKSAYYGATPTSIPYSIISLKEDYALFDKKGIVLNPSSLVFEGFFEETGGLAGMLPSDYEPMKK